MENLYAPPRSTLSVDKPGRIDAQFYVVAPRKLMVLYLGTAGFYILYWFYKQWKNYKASRPDDESARAIWAIPRAIFSIFFTHTLLETVRDSAADKETVAGWNVASDGSILVVLLIVSSILNRLSRTMDSLPLDFATLLCLLPIAWTLLGIQKRINAVCGDPSGRSNAGLTGANYPWLALGAVIWLLSVLGLVARLIRPVVE